MPTISVIVPIYNVEDYLQQCLESLAVQIHQDFEVVCVIDGATDSSPDIAERFAAADARFKVVRKENGGLSSARNFGVQHASGDYLAFVDADDLVTPDFCERIVAAFEDAKADALIFGASLVPPEATTDWFNCALSPESKIYEGFSSELMFSPANTPFVWHKAVRRDALADAGVEFDETILFGEDVVFLFALYPRMKRVASIPDKLYLYRESREGSFMATHRSDMERLTAHLSMLEIIYADWRELGLFDEYSVELFDWSRPYLLRGIENLTEYERRAHLAATGALWHEYFRQSDCEALALPDAESRFLLSLIEFEGDPSQIANAFQEREHANITSGPIEPLAVAVPCLCRGDGKLYAKLHVRASAPFERLVCAAKAKGNDVPVGAYPLTAGERGAEQDWVLELPILSTRSVRVTLSPDGRESGKAKLTFGYERAKWISRLNYRLHAADCAAIRDFERGRTFGRYEVDVTHRFEGGEDVVWRFAVKWVGDPNRRPSMRVLNEKGVPVDAQPLLFEFQEATGRDGEREHSLFMSLRLPRQVERFVLVAEDREADGEPIESGFTVVDDDRVAALVAENRGRMQHAGESDDRYGQWFAEHAASEDELAYQRATPIADGPTFEVIVVSADGDKGTIDATRESLVKQTYLDFSIRVVQSVDAEALLQSSADYIAFIEAGDVLEPNALYEYAKAICTCDGVSPDVLYCDEDVLGETGGYCQPSFKSRLNLDLHYCSDWVGNLLVVRRDGKFAFEPVKASSRTAQVPFAAWRYGCTLHAYERAATFTHVPSVLHHAKRKPFLNDDGALLPAMKTELQYHLDRRGIGGEVVDGPEPGSMRVRYALPQPRPLVSIIIPNKDHVDLLEPCVASILKKSTYDHLEIVIVENNSVDDQTFSYYERVQQEHDCVRVVRWEEDFNYSKIVNFGSKHAKGDYLLFLNNDTEVIEPGFIEEMVGLLQRPEVGVVGAKLLFRDDLVQHAGAAMGVYGAVAHVNQNRTVDDGGFMCRATLPGDFTGVTGACQMVRASDFSALGGYDEGFAVGFNDMDFCMRVLESGKLVAYTPYALLHHYEFSSRGRELADKAKLLRWKREQARFVGKWPEPFVSGDLFTSPSHAANTMHYQL